eukprot:PhM_4_TR15497/c0_g1_i1/m.4999
MLKHVFNGHTVVVVIIIIFLCSDGQHHQKVAESRTLSVAHLSADVSVDGGLEVGHGARQRGDRQSGCGGLSSNHSLDLAILDAQRTEPQTARLHTQRRIDNDQHRTLAPEGSGAGPHEQLCDAPRPGVIEHGTSSDKLRHPLHRRHALEPYGAEVLVAAELRRGGAYGANDSIVVGQLPCAAEHQPLDGFPLHEAHHHRVGGELSHAAYASEVRPSGDHSVNELSSRRGGVITAAQQPAHGKKTCCSRSVLLPCVVTHCGVYVGHDGRVLDSQYPTIAGKHGRPDLTINKVRAARNGFNHLTDNVSGAHVGRDVLMHNFAECLEGNRNGIGLSSRHC